MELDIKVSCVAVDNTVFSKCFKIFPLRAIDLRDYITTQMNSNRALALNKALKLEICFLRATHVYLYFIITHHYAEINLYLIHNVYFYLYICCFDRFE